MDKYILPRGYLSASSIGTYLRCGYQFKFRYVDGIVSPPNMALTQGTVGHKVFETYYNNVLNGGTRMSPSEAKDAGVDFLEKEIEKNEIKLSPTELNTHIKEVEILSESYVGNIAKDINPISVEDEVRYISRCGVELLGYLDLVHETEDRDEYLIADYKITGKKWNINQLRNSLQFKLYALSTGLYDIEVHNIVKTIKVPKVFNKVAEDGTREVGSNLRILNHSFQKEEADFLEEQIEAVARGITTGIFIPTDPGNWMCNPTWCGYWHLCRGKTRKE